MKSFCYHSRVLLLYGLLNKVLLRARQWHMFKMHPALNSQKTPHSSSCRMSYGVPFVSILAITPHVIIGLSYGSLFACWYNFITDRYLSTCTKQVEAPTPISVIFLYKSLYIWVFTSLVPGFNIWLCWLTLSNLFSVEKTVDSQGLPTLCCVEHIT